METYIWTSMDLWNIEKSFCFQKKDLFQGKNYFQLTGKENTSVTLLIIQVFSSPWLTFHVSKCRTPYPVECLIQSLLERAMATVFFFFNFYIGVGYIAPCRVYSAYYNLCAFGGKESKGCCYKLEFSFPKSIKISSYLNPCYEIKIFPPQYIYTNLYRFWARFID